MTGGDTSRVDISGDDVSRGNTAGGDTTREDTNGDDAIRGDTTKSYTT